MRGGDPLSYRGSGMSPGKILGNFGAGEVFLSLFLVKMCGLNLTLKAILRYFMQYFASILAYTGAVAGIQRKRKAMIRI